MGEEVGPSGKRPPTSEEIFQYVERELPAALEREGKKGMRRTAPLGDDRSVSVTVAKSRAASKEKREVPATVAKLSDICQRAYLALVRLRAEQGEHASVFQLQIFEEVKRDGEDATSLRHMYRALHLLVKTNEVRKSEATGFHIGGTQPSLPFPEAP